MCQTLAEPRGESQMVRKVVLGVIPPSIDQLVRLIHLLCYNYLYM